MWRLMRRIPIGTLLGCLIFALLEGFIQLLLPTLTGQIINVGIVDGNIPYIIRIGIIMFIVAVVSLIASAGNTYLSVRSSQGLGRDLRQEIFHRIMYFSKETFNQFGMASLITRASNDIAQIEMTISMILRIMLFAPSMLVSAIFISYQASPELSRVFLISLPLLFVAVGGIMYFAMPLFRLMQEKLDRLNLIFREGLTGIRVIRAFNKNDYEAERFDGANADYANTAIKANTYMALLMPIMILIISLSNIFIYWYGSQLVAENRLELGTIVAFISYATMVMFSFMMVAMIFGMIPRAQVSARRVLSVLDQVDTLEQMPNQVSEEEIDLDVPGSIVLNNVSFRHTGANKDAIDGVSFEVRPGETVGIIGGTGSGKTTVANLIMHFYDVSKGSVEVNGRDVREYELKALRQLIGFVPQSANLFAGTVRSNMLYGHAEASDAEIWRALGIAQATEFVEKMPAGLDSEVEERGNNFSGGQKQRLSIARALMKRANIYIFDDSFSALDYETEGKLRRELNKVTQDAAVIIISQRVSTLLNADKIVVLAEGKQVGYGTHEELVDSCEVYQEIVDSQMRGADDRGA